MPDFIKPDIETIAQRLDAVPGFNSMCFELFRQWSAKVKEEKENWEPDVEDEQDIIKSVRKAYATAIQYSYEDKDDLELMDMEEYYMVAVVSQALCRAPLARFGACATCPPIKHTGRCFG